MKRNTIIFAATCLSLHALATWSAFRGTNLITDILTGAWLISLAAVFVVLCRHSDDWRFRLPAFVIALAYATFVVYSLWSFFTKAD